MAVEKDLEEKGRTRWVMGFLVFILVAGFAGTGCGTSRIVYLEDEVPLAAPLEGTFGNEESTPGEERDDPPSRVARVSYLEGPVSVQPGGVEDWTPACLNLPMKGGDALWAPAGSRAELQVGPTGLRTQNGTSLSLLRMEDRSLQVGMEQGSVLVHVLPGDARDAVEVDTPAGAVTLATPGTYRVDMDPTRLEGSVTVRSGHADVSLEGEVIPVGPGKRIQLSAGPEPSYQVEKAPGLDGFETWSEGRDRKGAHSPSAQKLGHSVMGVEDLDGAGDWQTSPGLGEVWAPRVSQDWTPYRMGRWAWVDPWGWTWVDDAPWGFAPFHYGRWAHLSSGWVWVPGAPQAQGGRAVYAPALVAFVGAAPGPRMDPHIHGGGVAWFPLGPHEPYQPAYPVSRTYVRNINAWANPGQGGRPSVWANQAVPGAVTVIPRTSFTSFHSVAREALPVEGARAFRNAPVGPAPAVPPTLHSLGAGSGGGSIRPPAQVLGRVLVARTPLPPPPAAFAAREASLRAAQGRPLAPVAMRTLQVQHPALDPNQTARSVPGRAWRVSGAASAQAPLRNRAVTPPPAAVSGPIRRVEPWEVRSATPIQAPRSARPGGRLVAIPQQGPGPRERPVQVGRQGGAIPARGRGREAPKPEVKPKEASSGKHSGGAKKSRR